MRHLTRGLFSQGAGTGCALSQVGRLPQGQHMAERAATGKRPGWKVFGVGLSLYLLGLGFLGGIAAERIRFDLRRAETLRRYDEIVRRWHAYLVRLELEAAADPQRAAWSAAEAER